MNPSTISGINYLPYQQKLELYRRMIPPEIFEMFDITPELTDARGNTLIDLNAPDGSSTAEMSLYHEIGAPDPVLYGQITDTLAGNFHIMLYVLNDPNSPRFDVDRMPDGTPTSFGILRRNLEAELASLRAGLAPGQVRRGIRGLPSAIAAFENFVSSLGHEIYFAEPLFYHTALLFEQYGFTYEKGRRLMERIEAGFSPGGELLPRLDGSTPFRSPEAADSIRLRSWAIHDGILGEPYTDVTMYKHINKHAGVSTCTECQW